MYLNLNYYTNEFLTIIITNNFKKFFNHKTLGPLRNKILAVPLVDTPNCTSQSESWTLDY